MRVYKKGAQLLQITYLGHKRWMGKCAPLCIKRHRPCWKWTFSKEVITGSLLSRKLLMLCSTVYISQCLIHWQSVYSLDSPPILKRCNPSRRLQNLPWTPVFGHACNYRTFLDKTYTTVVGIEAVERVGQSPATLEFSTSDKPTDVRGSNVRSC